MISPNEELVAKAVDGRCAHKKCILRKYAGLSVQIVMRL